MVTKKAVCFGEVLWDVLPTEKIAGGAPMNVSIRLQSLGIETKMISKIGQDILGNELLAIIKNKQVATSLIQIDNQFSTGEVQVTLDKNKNAKYTIVYPSAWDKIELSKDNLDVVKEADVFVYGSLACRDEVSKSTLLCLLKEAKYKIFDVNIRPPFYSVAFLIEIMKISDFVKLNDDELAEVAQTLGSTTTNIETNILLLSEITNTKTICVTKGKDGAVLFVDQQFYSHSGFQIEVADTIGAGDSFLAALISKLLLSANYNEAITFACAVGAMVASKKGANPEISPEEIALFIQENNNSKL